MAEIAFRVSSQPSFCRRPRTSSRSRSSTIFSLSQGLGANRRLNFQLQPLNHIAGLGASSDHSSSLHLGSSYLRDRLSLNQSHLEHQQKLFAGVVSSDSQAPSFTAFEANQPEVDSGGGAGDGFGDRSGGGGDGGGGGDNNGGRGEDNKGEEGSDGDKRKMALSMSQKLTLGYAVLVGAGGLIGYLKSGSLKSLLAGGLSASLLYYVHTELPVRLVFASSVELEFSIVNRESGLPLAWAMLDYVARPASWNGHHPRNF